MKYELVMDSVIPESRFSGFGVFIGHYWARIFFILCHLWGFFIVDCAQGASEHAKIWQKIKKILDRHFPSRLQSISWNNFRYAKLHFSSTRIYHLFMWMCQIINWFLWMTHWHSILQVLKNVLIKNDTEHRYIWKTSPKFSKSTSI